MSDAAAFYVLLVDTDKDRTSSTFSLLNREHSTPSPAIETPLYEVSHTRKGKTHTIQRAGPVSSGLGAQFHQPQQYVYGPPVPSASPNTWTSPPPYNAMQQYQAPPNLPQTGPVATNSPVGTIKLHDSTSKIECTLRGHQVRLARTDILSMGAHKFTLPPELTTAYGSSFKWQESSLLGSGVEMVDEAKRKLVVYKKRLDSDKHVNGEGGSMLKKAMKYTPLVKSQKGFEIYLPLHQLGDAQREMLLDMIAVTGMAAMEYRRQSNEDWDKFGEEMFEWL